MWETNGMGDFFATDELNAMLWDRLLVRREVLRLVSTRFHDRCVRRLYDVMSANLPCTHPDVCTPDAVRFEHRRYVLDQQYYRNGDARMLWFAMDGGVHIHLMGGSARRPTVFRTFRGEHSGCVLFHA